MALSSDGRANNSAGFGGTLPEGSICKLLLAWVGKSKECRSILSSVRKEVIPFRCFCSRPKYPASFGLRISRPTITTRLPKRARLTPRLHETNVLPSPLIVEVIKMTLFSFFPKMNWRLVRILRNTSDIMLFSFSFTTMVEPFFSDW